MNSTLIIGLGGAGSKITANIYQKFKENNPSDEDREKYVCLCFDTDAQDVRYCKDKLPPEWVVKISSDLPLVAIYERMKNRSSVRENNQRNAEMNVIEALREEAFRKSDNDRDKAWKYIKRKIEEFWDRPRKALPINSDGKECYVNAWCMHPDSAANSTQTEADDLFGDTRGTRLVSESFSRFEITRVNKVYSMSISQLNLSYNRSDNYHPFTPYLDKRWESLLPDI